MSESSEPGPWVLLLCSQGAAGWRRVRKGGVCGWREERSVGKRALQRVGGGGFWWRDSRGAGPPGPLGRLSTAHCYRAATGHAPLERMRRRCSNSSCSGDFCPTFATLRRSYPKLVGQTRVHQFDIAQLVYSHLRQVFWVASSATAANYIIQIFLTAMTSMRESKGNGTATTAAYQRGRAASYKQAQQPTRDHGESSEARTGTECPAGPPPPYLRTAMER